MPKYIGGRNHLIIISSQSSVIELKNIVIGALKYDVGCNIAKQLCHFFFVDEGFNITIDISNDVMCPYIMKVTTIKTFMLHTKITPLKVDARIINYLTSQPSSSTKCD